jgi:hypothetical protein
MRCFDFHPRCNNVLVPGLMILVALMVSAIFTVQVDAEVAAETPSPAAAADKGETAAPLAVAMPHRDGGIRYALVSTGGKLLLGPILKEYFGFEEIADLPPRALAQTDSNRWGHLGADGKWIIEPTFEMLRQISEDRLARFSKGELWGFVDPTGKVVIDPKYPRARPFNHGLAAVCDSRDRWFYIATDGTVAIKGPFASALSFSSVGLAAVLDRSRKGWGYVDRTGTVVIKPRFADAGQFSESGLAPAQDRGSELYGMIDRRGRWRVQPKYSIIWGFNTDGFAAFAHASWYDGRGFFDSEGKIAFEGGTSLTRWMVCRRTASSYSNLQLLDERGRAVGDQRFAWVDVFSPDCVTTGLIDDRFGIIFADGSFQPLPTAEHEPLATEDGDVLGFRRGRGLVAVVNKSRGIDYFDVKGALRFQLSFSAENGSLRAELANAAGTSIWKDSKKTPVVVPPEPFFRRSEEKLVHSVEARTGKLASLVQKLARQPPRKFVPTSMVYDSRQDAYDLEGWEEEYEEYQLHRGAIEVLASRYVDEGTWGVYNFLSTWVGSRFDELFQRYTKELEATLGPSRAPKEVDTYEEMYGEILAVGDSDTARLWTVDGRRVILQRYGSVGDGDFEEQIWLAVLEGL